MLEGLSRPIEPDAPAVDTTRGALSCRVVGPKQDGSGTIFVDADVFDPFRHILPVWVREGQLTARLGSLSAQGSGVVRLEGGAPARVTWHTDPGGAATCGAPVVLIDEGPASYGWVHGTVSLDPETEDFEAPSGGTLAGVVSGCGAYAHVDPEGTFTVSVFPGPCTLRVLASSSGRAGGFRGEAALVVIGGADIEVGVVASVIASPQSPAYE